MVPELDPRLGTVREMLRADGYDLQSDAEGLRVVALDGACEDCLVSKEVMRMLIGQALQDPDAAASIVLRYPAET